MREFFRGWKRKVGCLTLVLALVLMCAWLRSGFEFDEYSYYSDNGMHKLFATEGRLGLFSYITRTNKEFIYVLSVDPDDVSVDVSIGKTPSQIAQRWEIIGFHFQAGQAGDEMRYAVYTIPYWSITIPLTLISLWLLLSKPRQSNRNKIVEPIQDERGRATT